VKIITGSAVIMKKAIIPDQLMTRYNNDEITLMIGDEIRRFVKSDEQIVTIGNYEYK
jgi:hypothetical protein